MHLDLTDDEVQLLVTNTGSHIGFLAGQIARAGEHGRPVPDEKRTKLTALMAVEASLCRQSGLAPVRPLPAPPRSARTKSPDRLRALLCEGPMSIADIRGALKCSDKHARHLLRAVDAQVSHTVGPHRTNYWRL